MTDQAIMKELEKFDTPSITNVVATYPKNDLCLGLYNPWTVNWYTDERIKCMYPELGPRCGYAVTCIYGLPDPGFTRLTFMDVADALDASPKPTILALEQKFPSSKPSTDIIPSRVQRIFEPKKLFADARIRTHYLWISVRKEDGKGIHYVMTPVPIVATHMFSRAAKLGSRQISPLPRNLVVN